MYICQLPVSPSLFPPLKSLIRTHCGYRCDTDEAQYRAAALALVQSGLKDLGYQYFNLCVPNPLLYIVWCVAALTDFTKHC